MQSEPLVSVVTPFYNTKDYLAECIESVLRQTYQNWEYVLIDNFSTDGSSEIAAHYASLHPEKIRVVKPGSFLSQVQNYNFSLTCISNASKYCKMVQADDWVFPDCIRSMVEVAEAHPKVAIVSAYELEGNRVSLDGLPYPSDEVPGREVGRRYFLKRHYLFGTQTSLLFRSDLVRSRVPFFDERRAPLDDAHLCFDLLKTWNFGFVHQVLTFSRRDNPSILSRIVPFGFLLFSRYSLIVVQGRDFLSDKEYKECLDDASYEYFSFLGRSALRGASENFWEFHRSSLASIDQKLDWKFLTKWSLIALVNYLGNPKSNWDRYWGRHRKIGAEWSIGLNDSSQVD
jgi:glycosyltransferase involved in cell wall biosynthesis